MNQKEVDVEKLQQKFLALISEDWVKHEDDYPYAEQTAKSCVEISLQSNVGGFSLEDIRILLIDAFSEGSGISDLSSIEWCNNRDKWIKEKLKSLTKEQPKEKEESWDEVLLRYGVSECEVTETSTKFFTSVSELTDWLKKNYNAPTKKIIK